MKKEKHPIALKIVFLILIALTQMACTLVEGVTINEFPEYVDYNLKGSAISEVGADPDPEGPAAPTHETYFEQDGIRLYYDPQLILDVEPPTETVPAADGEDMYEPAHPAFVHFNLYMEHAQVYVAPVEEYEEVADFAPGIISDLQRLNDSLKNFSDCVPELPLDIFFRVCDHQQFNANLAQLDFENGSGVRFVSVYGIQDLAPVDNENLVYVFQGFTDDGKYYVKAIVRILHSQLQDVGEIPGEIYMEDAAGVAVYFDDFEVLLNQNEDDFAPALEWIDAFLASLWVE